MDKGIIDVISTPPEQLEPCPMCAGTVEVLSVGGGWGAFDLRHAKFRCRKCGGVFEYAWQSDSYKQQPWAIEWWNTRSPAQLKTCCGYEVEQLISIAQLLKENEITPGQLNLICENLEKAVRLVKSTVIRDIDKQLQTYIQKVNNTTYISQQTNIDRICGLYEEEES